MNQSPRDKTEAKLYDAIASFNETAQWNLLRLAQMRQYLAEYLANALVPSWLHERKAETAAEEIAYVLMMVGLAPNDWIDAHADEVLRADGQDYPGEVTALRGLVAALAAVAQHGDLDEVRKLLADHTARDDESREAAKAADFFQPGHSYTHRNGTDFRCVTVTTHPQTGERLAMGWHVDSWGLHYPTTVGINQWRHEYDGVAAPAEAGEGE